jgi:hypothetical protein
MCDACVLREIDRRVVADERRDLVLGAILCAIASAAATWAIAVWGLQ